MFAEAAATDSVADELGDVAECAIADIDKARKAAIKALLLL